MGLDLDIIYSAIYMAFSKTPENLHVIGIYINIHRPADDKCYCYKYRNWCTLMIFSLLPRVSLQDGNGGILQEHLLLFRLNTYITA